YGNTLKNARPTFATASCTNAVLTPEGDFCVNPTPGITDYLVPRNYLTGAGPRRGAGANALTPGSDSSGAPGGGRGGMGGGGGRGGMGGGGGRGGGGG